VPPAGPTVTVGGVNATPQWDGGEGASTRLGAELHRVERLAPRIAAAIRGENGLIVTGAGTGVAR